MRDIKFQKTLRRLLKKACISKLEGHVIDIEKDGNPVEIHLLLGKTSGATLLASSGEDKWPIMAYDPAREYHNTADSEIYLDSANYIEFESSFIESRAKFESLLNSL